jgi:cystathionine gamma-synthase
LARDHEELLWEEDAEVLLNASWDLNLRNAKSNATTEAVTEFMRSHPKVDTVYYPKYPVGGSDSNTRLYEKWQRKANGSGYGSLFSIKFKNPMHSQTFYDALDTPKVCARNSQFMYVEVD